MQVAVGSTNPVKIKAAQQAFTRVWPDKNWQVAGTAVDSGVPDQPMSDEESITGARNRARKALKKAAADFGVGMEGGLQQIQGKWFDCGWMVVQDKDGNEGIGSTVRMETPKKMVEMIKDEKELGEVIDIIFDRQNSKQAEGHFGLMSNNLITRTHGYTDGLIVALSRFLHPFLFTKQKDSES